MGVVFTNSGKNKIDFDKQDRHFINLNGSLYEFTEELADKINSYIPDFLPSANNGTFVCPCCGNGANGHKNQGLSPYKYKKTGFNLYTCFSSCGKSFTTIKLYQLHWNNEHPEKPLTYYQAYAQLGIELGIIRKEERDTDEYIHRVGIKNVLDSFIREDYDFTNFIKEAEANNDYQYLLKRGISIETQKRFHVGLVKEWIHPVSLAKFKQGFTKNKPLPSKRCIIPRSNECYLARSTEPDIPKKYQKLIAGPSCLFNSSAIWNNEPLFCVEGEIDSMSIIEVGGNSIGLGSISLKNKFVNLLQNELTKEELTQKVIILMLDNDSAGMKANLKLMNDLIAIGIKPENIYFCKTKEIELEDINSDNIKIPENLNIIEFPQDFYKDANDWLVGDKESFTDYVYNFKEYTKSLEDLELCK